jgi:hypothetical protein
MTAGAGDVSPAVGLNRAPQFMLAPMPAVGQVRLGLWSSVFMTAGAGDASIAWLFSRGYMIAVPMA